MINRFTLAFALVFALGSASAQYVIEPAHTVDTVITEAQVQAAGLVVINNLVEGAVVYSEQGAVYADADTNCTGFYVTHGEYITLSFDCLPFPEYFEYRYSTWDKNHDKFDVYRCMGMHKVKLYMVALSD